MAKKTFQQLQRESDSALLGWWKAVELVSACKNDLYTSRQYLALREAEHQRDLLERVMAAARMAFLQARLEKGGKR